MAEDYRLSVTGLQFVSPPHVREYARNVGAERPDSAWILTDYDSWERNPWYQGPPQRHPEDDYPFEDFPDDGAKDD